MNRDLFSVDSVRSHQQGLSISIASSYTGAMRALQMLAEIFELSDVNF